MELKNYIENKSVAFVGMAPTIVGKSLGAEIDSFDVVFRTNIIPIPEQYREDYGSKCDVISMLRTSSIHPRFSSYGIKWVMHYPPIDKGKAPKDLNYYHMDVRQRNIIGREILKVTGKYPGHGTSGVNIITLVNQWKPKSLKVFGITGYQDKNGNVVDHHETKHYIDMFPVKPGITSMKRHPSHKLPAQNDYIRHLLRTNQISMDQYSMEYFK
jgi:hypothetical protein